MKPRQKQNNCTRMKDGIAGPHAIRKRKPAFNKHKKEMFSELLQKKNVDSEDYVKTKFRSSKKPSRVVKNRYKWTDTSPSAVSFSPETSDVENSDDGFDFSVQENNDTTENEGSSDSADEDSEIGVEAPVNFRVAAARKSGRLIVTVQHPVSFIINGTATIEVVCGAIDILGYEMNVFKTQEPVYSFPEHGVLQVKTIPSEYEGVTCVTNHLLRYASQEQVASVLETCNELSVILIFGKNLKATALHFACSYLPKTISFPDFKNTTFQSFQFTIETNTESAIQISKALKHAAGVIERTVKSFAKHGGSTPHFLVYGNKGRGKSTSLRYFINRVLSLPVERVLYLDADPGQPEFTIPGCISLTEINRPLLGPSFTHHETPLKCKFFGGLSIDSSKLYFTFLEEVIEYYNSEFSNEILFINTAGWIKGLGLSALNVLRVNLLPLTEVELIEKYDEKRSMKISDDSSDIPQPLIKLTVPSFGSKRPNVTPAIRRSLSILTYFGKLQPFWQDLKTLNAFQPYSVPYLESNAMHIIDCDLPDNQKLNIFNASIVALCEVDKSEIVPCIEGCVPDRLHPESNFGDCIGFGFVRGINVAKKTLYILTPVSSVDLRRVNALIKGHVQMPDEVFTLQKLPDNVLVPYMASMSLNVPLLEKKVKRRTFREK